MFSTREVAEAALESKEHDLFSWLSHAVTSIEYGSIGYSIVLLPEVLAILVAVLIASRVKARRCEMWRQGSKGVLRSNEVVWGLPLAIAGLAFAFVPLTSVVGEWLFGETDLQLLAATIIVSLSMFASILSVGICYVVAIKISKFKSSYWAPPQLIANFTALFTLTFIVSITIHLEI